MIKTVCERNKCTGCMACVNKCKFGAISIKDNILSYDAVIDMKKCVDCGACEKVCQVNHRHQKFAPYLWYQGWASDANVRDASSSGGYATAIAEAFVKNGGVVCSCSLNNGVFGFSIARSIDDVKQFTGSKYIKSNPVDSYKLIEKELKENKKVLYIALPCQIAAMKNYIPELLQERLYSIDLICHGTPSPKILSKFLHENGVELSELKDIRFRSKTDFQVTEGYKGIKTTGICDSYLISFLESISYTENCYECQYAQLERIADITLGDSWGSELTTEEKKGISLALITSKKGEEMIEDADLVLKSVDLDNAVKANHQLEYPSVKPQKYDYFFKAVSEGKALDTIVLHCYPKRFLKQKLKAVLIKLKILSGGGYNITIKMDEKKGTEQR